MFFLGKTFKRKLSLNTQCDPEKYFPFRFVSEAEIRQNNKISGSKRSGDVCTLLNHPERQNELINQYCNK